MNFLILFILIIFSFLSYEVKAQNPAELYYIGAGISDITGPSADQGMMGYGMVGQKTAGIKQRIWARAFILESALNGKKIVFVNADLGQLFQGIKQEVIRGLQARYGQQYRDENVLLTATHQHSGPGGYSTSAFYNLSTLGFHRRNFNTIVDGIVAAIEQAHRHMQKAHIGLNSKELNGVTINRSKLAYQQNPVLERRKYVVDTDNLMTQLRFDNLDGRPIGILNWFAIHGTSMGNQNFLINGDNKGYAAYLLEKDFGCSNDQPKDFIAAFAQSCSGDNSPNSEHHHGVKNEANVERAGRAQYEMSKHLLDANHQIVQGPIDYRHRFIKMDRVLIHNTQFTDGHPQKTCIASIGLNMLGGTLDGKGLDLNHKKLKAVLNTLASKTPCQAEKNIIIETGNRLPYPWTPAILPLQLFRIGDFAIAAVPFELTTMAGRRLNQTLLKELKPLGIKQVVLSTFANAYAGYVTTREEYKIQAYEGASTHFGPWTLAALQQEFLTLSRAMINQTSSPRGPTPSYLVNRQLHKVQSPALLETAPFPKKIGDLVDASFPKRYHIGDTVTVRFWGASPANNYLTGKTFLKVQRLEKNSWKTIRTDNDWDTEFHWERNQMFYSIVTIKWKISSPAFPGKYRIIHNGHYKIFLTHKVSPYESISPVFEVASHWDRRSTRLCRARY